MSAHAANHECAILLVRLPDLPRHPPPIFPIINPYLGCPSLCAQAQGNPFRSSLCAKLMERSVPFFWQRRKHSWSSPSLLRDPVTAASR